MSLKKKYRYLLLSIGILFICSCSKTKPLSLSTKNAESSKVDSSISSETLNQNQSIFFNEKDKYYESKLNKLNDKIIFIEEKLEQIESENSIISESLLNIENNIKTLSNSYNEIAQISFTDKINDLPLISTEDFKERYVESLAFYQNGEWEKSLEGFKYLVTLGTDTDLLDNCQYWIGEIYYKLKKYHYAIEEFKKVFLYVDSNKIDDALYKLSKSYAFLGDYKNANKVLVQLVENHPRSEYVTNAKELIK